MPSGGRSAALPLMTRMASKGATSSSHASFASTMSGGTGVLGMGMGAGACDVWSFKMKEPWGVSRSRG
eukprot:CAMPEP_0202417640 /NCGR_PEP_ID=MMETSP1128-20130828/43686_1 /ASSEMBLY_ACC=CAM_ASM_000463 /TAXON_ID=3047 /ORGANISM="Dunaliella tertiolecta, Strain CCMP1320" /LENGTH=67 /DNA_ID=CAMNT_0049025013 /DNA_START=570 /DNA_END=773 /DNA_ORIENTATION=+